MKKPQQQTVTSLPQSPDEERRSRVRKYTIAMSTRLLCFVLCIFTTGWWQIAFIAAAIILPYFAVVAANTAMRVSTAPVERPGAIVVSRRVDRPSNGE